MFGAFRSPSDWDDVKDVFQNQLGSRFLIHGKLTLYSWIFTGLKRMLVNVE